LAAFHSRSDALGRQFGDMSHRVLVGVTVCGQVIKVRNASDEVTVALAIDHRPIPDSVHALALCARDIPRVSAGENDDG